jgi:NADH-quinone oxidoreductase subunit G
MPTIYIDNKPFEVRDGQNLLEACLSLGLNVPYFCWHPALGSVGACRQCAVKVFKDENDKQGRIVMSCMTPATEGTRLSVEDKDARAFRKSVIEWLMTNHPHDCPVCDEGGECHLQDMTLLVGHDYREYRFDKRTYRNQDLGPFINHEMNRCIQCYRCVRYYRDYAGGRDLNAFASHNHVYFGRHEDGTLENEFSGNLVEVCPTGVFTDKTQKQHYTRRWDLQTAPSICVHCSVGCNTTPGERYGTLRRIRNRYNGDVNGYFLCDRGRYGYEFVNDMRRFYHVLHRIPDESFRRPGQLVPVIKSFLLPYLGSILAPGAKVVGIGSPRASLESNYALRTLVGPDQFHAGVADPERQLTELCVELLQTTPAHVPSLREASEADAVLLLGEDVTNTAPMIALALRQTVRRQPMKTAEKMGIPDWNDYAVRNAVQDAKGPFYVATPAATALDDIATEAYRAAPDDIARLGAAVAHALDPQAPEVPDLADDLRALAERIADQLKSAERPLVVSGPSLGNEAVLRAAASVAKALATLGRPAELFLGAMECNSTGLALIGGKPLEDALDALTSGAADTVIVLENDLFRRADRDRVSAALQNAKHVIVLDHMHHETTNRAELVLPAGTYAESDGTFVNNEGRAQRFIQVYMPEGDVQDSWRWLRDLAVAAGRVERGAWHNLDAIVEDMAEVLPQLHAVHHIAPPANFRIAGLKIPRQSHRFSGRTAMKAHLNVSEGRPPEDPDSPLAFSMEGYRGQAPASLSPNFWAPGWNSVQSVTKFQDEIGGSLAGGDPGQRLIETEGDGAAYDTDIPEAFRPRADERYFVPLYHIFGSEELSVYTPAVAQRAPLPYVALNEADAAALDAGQGSFLDVELNGQSVRLPIRIRPELPEGVAGLPVGLRGAPWLPLPGWGRLRKGTEQ